MKEARLTCRTQFYRVGDLNLRMVRGEERFVSAEEARASSDLRVAQKAGAIEVLFVERSREIRQPVQSQLRVNVPPKSKHAIIGARPVQVPQAAPPELTKEQVSELIRAHLADFKGDLSVLLRELLGGQTVVQAPVAGTVTQAREKAEGPELVFVPQHIMRDHKADISVEETEESGTGVDAAIEALRAARKKETP